MVEKTLFAPVGFVERQNHALGPAGRKVSFVFEEIIMAIRAYADKHGIGIFQESDDDRGPMDLRLNDMDSFLAFTLELLLASKKTGWFTSASIQYVLAAERETE